MNQSSVHRRPKEVLEDEIKTDDHEVVNEDDHGGETLEEVCASKDAVNTISGVPQEKNSGQAALEPPLSEHSEIENTVPSTDDSLAVHESVDRRDLEPVVCSDHDSVTNNEANSSSAEDETQRAVHDTICPDYAPNSTSSPSTMSGSLLKDMDVANMDILPANADCKLSRADSTQPPLRDTDSRISSPNSTDRSSTCSLNVKKTEVDDTQSSLHEEISPRPASVVNRISDKTTQTTTVAGSVSAIAPVKTDSIATTSAETGGDVPLPEGTITKITSNTASSSPISQSGPESKNLTHQSKTTSKTR